MFRFDGARDGELEKEDEESGSVTPFSQGGRGVEMVYGG